MALQLDLGVYGLPESEIAHFMHNVSPWVDDPTVDTCRKMLCVFGLPDHRIRSMMQWDTVLEVLSRVQPAYRPKSCSLFNIQTTCLTQP